MNPSAQSSLPYLGIPVQPADVERELIKIWREAAQDDAEKAQKGEAAGEISARVKATLANLIILEGDTSSTGMKLDELITDLCLSFPSRFCIVRYRSQGQPAELKTGVSSRCVLARSGAHVCSEELYFGTGPESVKHVPNMVLSVLVPDTPVVLLMFCDPTEEKDPAFHQLLRSLRYLSDRVIFDSRHTGKYSSAVDELLEDTADLVVKGSYGCSPDLGNPNCTDIRDLTWQRMGRWRSLITELFDGDRAAAPANISSFRIETEIPFADQSKDLFPVSALLLCGWFASKLGWKFTSGRLDPSKNAALLEAESPGLNRVAVEIIAQPCGKGVRRIKAVEIGWLQTGPNQPAITESGCGLSAARIERNLTGGTVDVSTTFCTAGQSGGSQTVKRLSPFASISGVSALTYELMSRLGDPDYRAALDLSRVIWKRLSAENSIQPPGAV